MGCHEKVKGATKYEYVGVETHLRGGFPRQGQQVSEPEVE